MAEETKSEADVYKELYEKSKKENERLKINAAKTIQNKPITEPTTVAPVLSKINPNGELIALKLDYESFKQEISRAVSAAIQQLNAYGTQLSNFGVEQEKIRTQVRANYNNISGIANLINSGGK